jgi:transcriptional regulator with XRE-family HTH domain
MGAIDEWAMRIRELKAERGHYERMAEALGVHRNTILRWARGLPPETRHEPMLALFLGLSLDRLRRLLDRVRHEWLLQQLTWERQLGDRRPQPPTPAVAAPRGSTLPPDSPPPRRRRRASALVIAGLSLTSLAGAPGQRPITAGAQVREMTSEEMSSVKSRSRRAA